MAKLETIEGVGPALSEKLESAGIASCESLLESGATKSGRGSIAAKTGLTEIKILKLVNHADLMRIKGVGGEYAELLEAAGVDSVPELAQRNAENLLGSMTSINAEKNLVRALPALKQVESWVEFSRDLPKVVQH